MIKQEFKTEPPKEDFHDKWVRAVAEFDNYKKRAAKEYKEIAQFSQEKLIQELLVILDDFDRVLDHLPEEDSPTIQSLVKGAEHVHSHLLGILKKHGLEELSTKSAKFDPHLHEALAPVESDSHEAGAIVEVKRKGYRLHDRLIRPALVTVAKPKSDQ